MAKAIKKFDKGGATKSKGGVSRDLSLALFTFGVPKNAYKQAVDEAKDKGLNPVQNYGLFRDLLIKHGAVNPPKSIDFMRPKKA